MHRSVYICLMSASHHSIFTFIFFYFPKNRENDEENVNRKSSRRIISRSTNNISSIGTSSINFRLHENLERNHQSRDVCRINSMFNGKKLLAASRDKMATNLSNSSSNINKDINQNLIHSYDEER